MDNSADWIFPKDFILNPRGDNADGSGMAKDRDNRSKTIWFMEDMSRELNMDRRVLYTASVYFHRFYLFHSFQKQNRFYVALACLFLAAKVEERAYKLRELVHCYFVLRFRRKPDDAENRDTPKQVILAERLVLHTLNFELNVTHPYNIFVAKMRDLRSYVPEDSRKNLMQTAVNFLNDSYRGTFCLEYSPTEIAVAVLYLATIALSVRPNNPNPRSMTEVTWISVLVDHNIREYRLRCLCLEIMDMYEHIAYLLQEAEDVVQRLERKHIASQLVSEMGGIVPAHLAESSSLLTDSRVVQDNPSTTAMTAVIEDDQTTLDAMTPREKSMSFASLQSHDVHSSSSTVPSSQPISLSSSEAHHRAIEASFVGQMHDSISNSNQTSSSSNGANGLLAHVLGTSNFDQDPTISRRPIVTVTKVSSASIAMTANYLSLQTPASVAGMEDLQHHSHAEQQYMRGDLSTISHATTTSMDEVQFGSSSYYPHRGNSGGASDETPVFYRTQAPSDTPTFADLGSSSHGNGLGSNGGSAIKSVRQRSRSNSLTSEYSDYPKRLRVE